MHFLWSNLPVPRQLATPPAVHGGCARFTSLLASRSLYCCSFLAFTWHEKAVGHLWTTARWLVRSWSKRSARRSPWPPRPIVHRHHHNGLVTMQSEDMGAEVHKDFACLLLWM